MIRIATIGTSVITAQFIRLAQNTEGIQVSMCYSRDLQKAEKFAADHQVAGACASLEALADNTELEAVYIASPNHLHAEQVLFFLQRGKHVLCEKPMGSNSREMEEMIRTARQKHLVLMEEMRTVHDPAYQLIRDNLKKLGTIRRVRLEYCQYSSKYDAFKNGVIANSFRLDRSAGALMDIGVYPLHALAGLFGETDQITAKTIRLETGADGMGTILLQYPQMLAEVCYSKITESSAPSEIQGEDGTMYIEKIQSPGAITICYQNGTSEVVHTEPDLDNMRYAIADFRDALLGKLQAEPFQELSLCTGRMLDLARKDAGICFPADQNGK